ncbi:hypothetical protein A3L12_03280 [Thermococcus sp. P6]|uniref:DUF5305 family protein n=1 Tax=Thermococcus sp. P6 TaxID=122420 RepID=UPI000B59C294|nr:DUF5305 family protein [Thermococcus sp. P6]ASJ10391.1 hypothetical protein A3L12_03280 [Thermococcus sp. P6]
MKRKKLNGFFRRKETLGVFLILFVVFAFYSLKFMSANPYVVNTERTGTFREAGELRQTAYLKPNELYGTVVSRGEYPISLVRGFRLEYTYSSDPALEEGTYEVTGRAVYYVNRGSEEAVLWEETLFEERGELQDGGFTVEKTLDMEKLDGISSNVSEELGIKRLNRRITVTARVSGSGEAGGERITEKFDHTAELVRDGGAGLYYFTNTNSTVRKTLTSSSREKVSASLLGITMDLGTARIVTPLVAMLMLIPPIGYLYTSRPEKDELGRIRGYVVEGKPGEVRERITVKTPGDLEKVFELVDRPVLHYVDGDDEVFAIIDGGTSYEYRKPPDLKKNSKD